MLRGTNKHVLEVTNPENPYFEKIIFFVSPEHENDSRRKLTQQARAVSDAASALPPFRRTKKERLRDAGLIALGMGAGISITAMLLTLL